MKATELRIGNLVEYEGNNVTVNSFTRKKLIVKRPFSMVSAHIDEFEPIPLTEEWLLKFGWVLGDESTLWEERDYTLGPCTDGTWIFLFLDYMIVTDLKHVHTLQNLYFALTGTELTIKNK